VQWAQRVYVQHYTPPDPQAGRGFDFIFYYMFRSCQFSHCYISTGFLAYCSNKVLYFALVVLFNCQCSLDSILWYMLQVYFGSFKVYPLIFGRHVFSAGGLSPPPRSRAPRQEGRTSRSIMWTRVLLLELHNCTLLSMGVWIHQGIVPSWDGICVSWFHVKVMKWR
jgi:hypothetical protein